MDYYYRNNVSEKVNDIGRGINKLWVMRKAKKIIKWYFQDRFGFTLNMIGLIMVVI